MSNSLDDTVVLFQHGPSTESGCLRAFGPNVAPRRLVTTNVSTGRLEHVPSCSYLLRRLASGELYLRMAALGNRQF